MKYADEIYEKLNNANKCLNIGRINRFIRKKSHLTAEEKCNCVICSSNDHISNHHVMKVEYIGTIAKAYNLCEVALCENVDYYRHMIESKIKTKERNISITDIYSDKKNNNNKNIINKEKEIDKKSYIDDISDTYVRYKEGIDMCYPRVAVCEKHHRIFHELNGDYGVGRNRIIEYDEAEKIIKTISDLDNLVDEWYEKNDSENVPEYKKTYKKVWDASMTNSLITLENIIEKNEEIENNFDEEIYINDFINDVLDEIEDPFMIDEVINDMEEMNDFILNDCIIEDKLKEIDFELEDIKDFVE